MNKVKKPALFLDRDGVINEDHGYVFETDKFKFIDGIFELVSAANTNGYLVVVVTNQAGIGRGYYTEDDFNHLTYWMCQQFKLHEARIDSVYYCAFHPEHGVGKYKHDSINRKPGPGMIFDAAKELSIDLKLSILLGDKSTDILAGQRAGIQELFLLGKKLLSTKARLINNPAELIAHLKSY